VGPIYATQAAAHPTAVLFLRNLGAR